MRDLLREIHRRSVWQVFLIYVGLSWAVIEAIQGLTEATGLPEWFPSFAVGLLLIGLPIVLATAVVQRGAAEEPVGRPADEPGRVAGEAAVGGPGPHHRADGSEPASSAVHRLLTWRNAIGGGVLAMALWGVVATAWLLLGTRPPAEPGTAAGRPTTAAMTVAVLPFANLSPDEENAFFAAGIHEDILTQLSKIAALTVISRTSVLSYASTEKSLRQVGDELGAGTILEGSVRRVGDQVRITTQLIDTETDAHLWAETYDRELTHVFEVQSDIARRVAGALEAALTPAEEARLATAPTESLTAYDLYLRGREAYNLHTVESNNEAIRLFRAALEVDPEYALAWAGLSDAFAQGGGQFGLGLAFVDSARAAAETALRLDPDLAEAYKALGLIHFMSSELDEMRRANLRALELNPNHEGAINNIGVGASTRGQLDEALVWYRRAARVSPNLEYPRTNAAEIYTLLGDFDTADRWLRDAEILHPEGTSVIQQRTYWHLFQGDAEAAYRNALQGLEAHPDHPGVHAHVGFVALFAGLPQEARAHLEESLRMAPDGGWELHPYGLWLATALGALGEGEAAAEHLARVEGFIEASILDGRAVPYMYWDLAGIAAQRGDPDGAVEQAQTAYDAGFRYGIHSVDPVFAPVRDDPRFQAIMTDFTAEYARMRASVEATERAEGIR